MSPWRWWRSRVDRLLDTADDFELCDGVFCKLAERDDTIDVATWDPEERVVTLAWHAMGLIGNGGFYYLFSADYRGDPGFVHTAASYRTIGAEAAYRCFQDALGRFPGNRPHDDLLERRAFYAALPEAVRQPIDVAFWAADDEVPTKLAAYIRANRPALQRTLEAKPRR